MKKQNTCVVTGASSGIGKGIALALLERGRQVVNLDARMPDWEHPLLISHEVDLSQEQAVADAAARVAGMFEVTALVNNAGTTRPGTADTQTAADLDYVAGLHLRAPMLLMQAFLPSLRACGQGRIVNISSRAALGLVNRLAYSTTKAGLIGMTRTLALELGKDGITVNAIAPGPVVTELYRRWHSPEAIAKTAAGLPVRRIGAPEDIAAATLFFLAPESGFVTGQVLNVCGGSSLGLVAQ
ncbi:MAG TPA: SDR family oxidoreductase [Ramlibacter sp.]|nr:SDR family oxidoreductase [Ramlibacter sp.]